MYWNYNFSYGSQMLENLTDIFLHVNEFIMPAVLQIYLIAVLFLKSYIKLCDLYSYLSYVCVFFGKVPGIFAESNIECR